MKLGVIFACDYNGGIGYDNKMPWLPHKEDFAQFKAATMGKPMIMGRNTFDSLPGILPGREHIVITSDPGSLPDHPQVFAARDLRDALKQLEKDYEMAWVIGGKRVIEEVVPIADIVRLTKMFGEYVTTVNINHETMLHIHQRYEYSEQLITGSDFAVIEFHRFKPENKGMTLN